MKLLYKKEKYKRFNKHKIEKLKKKKRKKNLRRCHYAAEVEQYNTLLADKKVITFPEMLYLANENETIFNLIAEAEDQDRIVLDFSQTKRIDIGSAIYIRAFVDYLKDKGKKYTIVCLSKNKKMRQILQHIGVYNYNIKKVIYPDIKCWEVRSWQKNDKVNYGKVMMEEILPKVLENKIASDTFANIAASLQEILSNCSEHAYTEDDEYKNYYLIAGEYEHLYGKSNLFTFCILDRGQGFRTSLAKNTVVAKLVEIFADRPDSDLLEAAISGKFTSKQGGGELAGRGTGLSNVVENVKNINGSFYVYSDKGSYEVNRQKAKKRERHICIKGAIIEMILPINEQCDMR